MDVTIRTMQESDWNDVSDIYRQGIETGNATFQTVIPSSKECDDAHIKVCRFVALDGGGKIIGWAALSKISSRFVYRGVADLSIYIAEVVRGKGIGEKLLNYIVTESEKSGFWILQSGIMKENIISLKLHQKCGFRVVGTRERIGLDKEGNWRSTVLMERRSKVVGI